MLGEHLSGKDENPMSPKLKIGATVAVLLGFVGLLQLQQIKIKRLMADNADLRSQLGQMESTLAGEQIVH